MNISSFLKNGLLQRTFIYTFSSSLNALVAFLLLPILTVYLSPFDYGVIELVTTIAAIVTALVIFGGNTLISKEYFAAGVNRELYISNVFSVVVLIAFIVIFLFVFLIGTMRISSDLLQLKQSLIFIAILIGISNAIVQIHLVLYQLEKKALKYGFFLNGRSLSEIVISLVLVVFAGMAWEGRIIGMVSTTLFFLAIALILIIKRNVKFKYPKEFGKQILKEGAPLVAASILGWAVLMSDRLLVNIFVDTESVGIFSVAARFGMLIMMIGSAFTLAWLPFFYEKINSGDDRDKRRIVSATYLFLGAFLIVSLLFGIFGKYLLYFMVDSRFHSADRLIFWLSMAFYCDAVWKVFSGYLLYKNKTFQYTFIVFLSSALNILLNCVLLPKYGIQSAAWATFISFAIGMMITVVLGCRCVVMPWYSLK